MITEVRTNDFIKHTRIAGLKQGDKCKLNWKKSKTHFLNVQLMSNASCNR